MASPLLRFPVSLPVVREGPAVYRPRRPERTAFYQVIEGHFDEFALTHEERFEREDGPLRPVVRKAVDGFLACGRPEAGFARARCPECRAGYLVATSCQTRDFSPACRKRALLFPRKLLEEILCRCDRLRRRSPPRARGRAAKPAQATRVGIHLHDPHRPAPVAAGDPRG
jgi:hypothetical protein